MRKKNNKDLEIEIILINLDRKEEIRNLKSKIIILENKIKNSKKLIDKL